MRKFKTAKFDEIQIKNGALEQDGRTVAALLKKKDDCEVVAYEKAGHEPPGVQGKMVSWSQTVADQSVTINRTRREDPGRSSRRRRGASEKSREKKKAAVTVTAAAKPAALPAPVTLALPAPTKYSRPITRLAELIMVTDRLLSGLEPAAKQTFLTHVLNHPQMVGVKPLQTERKCKCRPTKKTAPRHHQEEGSMNMGYKLSEDDRPGNSRSWLPPASTRKETP